MIVLVSQVAMPKVAKPRTFGNIKLVKFIGVMFKSFFWLTLTTKILLFGYMKLDHP